jgi:hypothetical protein
MKTTPSSCRKSGDNSPISMATFTTSGLFVGIIRMIFVDGAKIITAELSSTSFGRNVSRKSAGSEIGLDSCSCIIFAMVTADIAFLCLHKFYTYM